MKGLDHWITEGPRIIDGSEYAWCSIYDELCLHDGEECGARCAREVRSAEDSDEAADRADHDYDQWRG